MRRIIPAAFAVWLLTMSAASPAHAILKDTDARKSLEELRIQLNQVEAALQVRQMGLGEQLQTIREELGRIESRIDENRRETKLLSQQLDVSKIETRENLVQIDHNYQKRFQALDENIARMVKGIGDIQKNIKTLSDNIQTMSAFEKKQEERIGQIQAQLQEQLKVVVEEVGKENSRLNGEIGALRGDIGKLSNVVSGIDGRLRSLSGYTDQIARRQDALVEAAQIGATPGVSTDEHIVQKGETLSIIAQQYGVSVEQILDINNISDANLIRVGQRLRISGP